MLYERFGISNKSLKYLRSCTSLRKCISCDDQGLTVAHIDAMHHVEELFNAILMLEPLPILDSLGTKLKMLCWFDTLCFFAFFPYIWCGL